MPDYISVADAAAKWGISIRRVRVLCEQERIPGVFRLGAGYAIPVSAEKPDDRRIKSGKYIKDPSEYKRNKKTAGKDGERE